MDDAYVCLECGHTFDTPKKWTERHGLETPPYEELTGCPACGGAYIELRRCAACNNPITGEYVHIPSLDSDFCEDCYTHHHS